MSRNDSPRRTQSSDLARSMPIEVPSPPLSLITAVVRIASAAASSRDLDVGQRLHVERLDRGLGDHPGLAVLEQPVVVGEDLDRRGIDPGRRHLVARPVQPCTTHAVDRRLAPWRPATISPRTAPPPAARRQDRPARPAGHRPATAARWPRSAGARPRSPTTCWPPRRYAGPPRVAAYVSVGREPGTGAAARRAAARRASGSSSADRRRLTGLRAASTWTGRRTTARSRWRRPGSGCSSRPRRRSGVDAIAHADVVLVPGLAVSPDGRPARQGRRLLRPGARPGAGRHLHLRAAVRRRGRRRRPGRAARPAGDRRRHPVGDHPAGSAERRSAQPARGPVRPRRRPRRRPRENAHGRVSPSTQRSVWSV